MRASQTYPPAVLISCDTIWLSHKQKIERRADLWGRLFAEKVQFKEVQGSYKGVKETSFLCLSPVEEIPFFIQLAYHYHQKTILYLDKYRDASLLFVQKPYTPSKYLGRFVSAPEYVALKQEAYTYDYTNRIYYVVKPNQIGGN